MLHGPGMGLFEFRHMPFGLIGDLSTFQRLMNQIFVRLHMLPPILMIF